MATAVVGLLSPLPPAVLFLLWLFLLRLLLLLLGLLLLLLWLLLLNYRRVLVVFRRLLFHINFLSTCYCSECQDGYGGQENNEPSSHDAPSLGWIRSSVPPLASELLNALSRMGLGSYLEGIRFLDAWCA